MLLNDEQELVRQTAADFASEVIAPSAREWERAGCIPRDVLRKMGELGFLGMTVPEAYGGAGLDYVSYAAALIEVAGGDGGLSTLMSVNNAPVCAILLEAGSAWQKERFLAPMARGEMIGAFALTEPQAGSDAANLKTTAVRRGSGYVLSGTKQFITSGNVAGAIIAFAVTDPSAGKRGISAFVVPKDMPGVVVLRTEQKMGQKSSDTCQVMFDGVQLDESNLIGAEGEGYRIALSNLETGRIGIAAQSVGMAQAALHQAVMFCRERGSFGQPIINHQAVGFRLASMATELEAARSLVFHAAAMKDAGRRCLKEACMAKLFASEAAERICSGAVQCLGGYGYVDDYPVEKIYRDVRVCQIYEGTSDIQRLIISRELTAGNIQA
jgi:alkylation response protein AidB-like acyl-CoA dehydrogenase